ncbi:nucleotidyl transferase AbiEii/AbiGii toxin family protein [Lysinibacillus sp. FSL K6-0232]|uniref:nucleotidyl transferase AbiEii/AbiGii toxin family protein n=1 Tax=Lysinibacillus sp. FSL K6-0232 TaxID=2921425 RepID=UPI0030F970A5
MATTILTQLTAMAEAQQKSLTQLLTAYCQERLLYRLSVSSYNDQFYLENIALQEIALLTTANAQQATIAKHAFQEICAMEGLEDELIFLGSELASSVTANCIRLKIPAKIADKTIYIEVMIYCQERTRITPKLSSVPALLDMEPAMLYTYPVEFVLAQKIVAQDDRAIVQLMAAHPIEGRALQGYVEELLDQQRLTMEACQSLTVHRQLQPFLAAILTENEYFQQWYANNQAWQ